MVHSIRPVSWARSIALLLPLLGLVAPASATVLVKSAFSGGAVATSGGSFTLLATVGEAGVVGSTIGGSFRLTQGFWGGSSEVATDAPAPSLPAAVQLLNGLRQNAPNPFTANTEISFTVATASPTRLEVYDVLGRRVRTLIHEVSQPGRYRVRWDGRDTTQQLAASGVYFYRLSIGDWSETRKMLRLR